MENVSILLLFAIVLIIAMLLAAVIGYFWASSTAKSDLLKQQKEHSETIYTKAQEQLQKWKEQELIPIRQQILESARGEAIKEAQEQLVRWRTEELEKTKSQMWEILTKEATVSLEQWKVEKEREIRQDAIGKSQSVTMGKMTEHMVPYLPGFRFNPSDARFIGSPIDFVVFDGLGDDEVRKIVFVEIKTGASNLSTRERSVRNAILDKNVEWLELKVNLDNPEVIQEYQSRRNNKRSE
jgi:predicted Holliday junction resolvase-like endonuclease